VNHLEKLVPKTMRWLYEDIPLGRKRALKKEPTAGIGCLIKPSANFDDSTAGLAQQPCERSVKTSH
jgi:hypothetical protein